LERAVQHAADHWETYERAPSTNSLRNASRMHHATARGLLRAEDFLAAVELRRAGISAEENDQFRGTERVGALDFGRDIWELERKRAVSQAAQPPSV
jgi:hypothetical protein